MSQKVRLTLTKSPLASHSVSSHCVSMCEQCLSLVRLIKANNLTVMSSSTKLPQIKKKHEKKKYHQKKVDFVLVAT